MESEIEKLRTQIAELQARLEVMIRLSRKLTSRREAKDKEDGRRSTLSVVKFGMTIRTVD